MSYVPSMSLGEVWSSLYSREKSSNRDQFNVILMDLRSIPYSEGTPFGGVGGKGCKDIRRTLRHSSTPIMALSKFEDFLCTSSIPGGRVFLKLLHQLSPYVGSAQNIVFTHGDLRPNHIVVDVSGNVCTITWILDWEYSGFYPEYYESIRWTKCLSPYDEDDWYLYFPDCVSSKPYAHWWLLGRVRVLRVL